MVQTKLLFLLSCFVMTICSIEDANDGNDTVLLDRLSKLETSVHQLQLAYNRIAGQKPAFFATLTNDFVIVHDAVVKFDTVKTNIGNGYDKITGMFVAPRNGTYSFTSVLYNSYKSYVTVKLMANGELLAKGYTSNSEFANTHTMNAVVSLKKGNSVYVIFRGFSFQKQTVYGSEHSSFSGFLISN